MINLIETPKVKDPVIADTQGLDLSDAPVHQGVVEALALPRLVCRDVYMLLEAALDLEAVQFFADEVGLELAGTPARFDTWPA